mmetsp:Transcript_9714/g.13632  ORF Transcript_9714/g.13632 Transcript_9714/m.13632 type:complete len:108 (+) Transcript_9714:22-345(+)
MNGSSMLRLSSSSFQSHPKRFFPKLIKSLISTASEVKIENILKTELKANEVKVDDISGGCGSMYSITVASPIFKDLTLVNQHKLVKRTLKDEIANMHGLTLVTKVSK